MKADPIPVWLVTGFLGSGKTTLLTNWLRDPSLADAALVINELGEVGVDDRLLASAVDSATLLADACVCCSGLGGLEETLTALWWDRLQRRRPRFGSVVVETTGMADPRPIARAFDMIPFLKERYVLAGVFTTVSSITGSTLVDAYPEARAQVQAANVLIVTKCDRTPGSPLANWLRQVNPSALVALSSQASMGWPEAYALILTQNGKHAHPAGQAYDGEIWQHSSMHGSARQMHRARTRFIPLNEAVTPESVVIRIDALQRERAIRVKGLVKLGDGSIRAVQWALGDIEIQLSHYEGHAGSTERLGLTCVLEA